jgi:hypothetical protein
MASPPPPRLGLDLEGGVQNFNAIRGVKDAPDVSFEEAIAIASQGCPALQGEDFSGEIFLTTMFADGVSVSDKGILTNDEISAINFYTKHTKFYPTLNEVMRSLNRALVEPFLPYLKLLLSGLYKLPLPDTPKTVYRGVKKQLYADYPADKKCIWWAFSSATATISVVNTFIGISENRSLFAIETRRFVDIRKFSAFQNLEDERLILPGTLLKVKSVANQGSNLYIIQMEDISSPPLLDFSHPQLNKVIE